MEFKDRLVALLNEHDLKQIDLSKMTGLSAALISFYVNGQRTPSLENAIAIADALNISLDELAGRPLRPPFNVTAQESEEGRGMFASNLKMLRHKQGLSQTTLGERLGVAQQTIGKWEQGIAEPSIGMIGKIATLFSVTTDRLLGVTPEGNDMPVLSDEETMLLNRFNSLVAPERNLVLNIVATLAVTRPAKDSARTV